MNRVHYCFIGINIVNDHMSKAFNERMEPIGRFISEYIHSFTEIMAVFRANDDYLAATNFGACHLGTHSKSARLPGIDQDYIGKHALRHIPTIYSIQIMGIIRSNFWSQYSSSGFFQEISYVSQKFIHLSGRFIDGAREVDNKIFAVLMRSHVLRNYEIFNL